MHMVGQFDVDDTLVNKRHILNSLEDSKRIVSQQGYHGNVKHYLYTQINTNWLK